MSFLTMSDSMHFHPSDRIRHRLLSAALFSILILWHPFPGHGAHAPVSEATEECLRCHSSIHPGIVEDWRKSRHAMISPESALKVTGTGRKISVKAVPDYLLKTSVGCAECHTINAGDRPGTFTHNEWPVHTVVSPRDCAVCHAVEAGEYAGNIMAHARSNLLENPLYQNLQQAVIGRPVRHEGNLTYAPANPETRAEACYYCHGTRLEIRGPEVRETVMGEMVFLRISGWPNQGAGRINPDGSMGNCSSCHSRHLFSIETARKPASCRECHLGPDVPAYKVYLSSKHGNIYTAKGGRWNFSAVPWTVGKDFSAPTCAACHISLITDTDGQVVARRTHAMSDRLAWRIFGLIYAHPHPQSPDTTQIHTRTGLPLPTDLDGTPAAGFLIGTAEQERRTEAMQAVCKTCHAQGWVDGHRKRFENTIDETNAAVRTATDIMREIWGRGFAEGPDPDNGQDQNPFDESVERLWAETWLFYGNTVRFTSAMGGGGDYGVFADGRHQLSRNISRLHDWLDLRIRLLPPTPPPAEGNETEESRRSEEEDLLSEIR